MSIHASRKLIGLSIAVCVAAGLESHASAAGNLAKLKSSMVGALKKIDLKRRQLASHLNRMYPQSLRKADEKMRRQMDKMVDPFRTVHNKMVDRFRLSDRENAKLAHFTATEDNLAAYIGEVGVEILAKRVSQRIGRYDPFELRALSGRQIRDAIADPKNGEMARAVARELVAFDHAIIRPEGISNPDPEATRIYGHYTQPTTTEVPRGWVENFRQNMRDVMLEKPAKSP